MSEGEGEDASHFGGGGREEERQKPPIGQIMGCAAEGD